MPEGTAFFDTCVRIGHSRAPDPPGNVADTALLAAAMQRHSIGQAAVEHAVAMEASPRLGHGMLAREIAGHPHLRPAWHLMPDISPRIERAVTDPAEILRERVALGRVDAKDFCQGAGDRACFGPVLDACAAVRLPVFIDFRRQGDLVTFDFAVCERHPDIPFVIEGFGGYPLHRVMWCLKEYPNFYVSTVGLAMFNGVRFLCDAGAGERLVFGTGWPASSMGMALGVVLLGGLSPAERAAVASGNFQRLLDRIGRKGAGR